MPLGLFSLVAWGAIGYIALCAILYFGQNRSIFFPGPNDPRLRQDKRGSRVEIAVSGATLEGWWTENPTATSSAVIVYFGGNAEDVLQTAATASRFNARQMFFTNYRGYGRSSGTPGQQSLYDDALAIYAHAIEKGVRPNQIVVMGRSLGSGVASMLAGARPVHAAVLVTPFASLTAVAAEHYPWLPVRLLLRHPFPSTDWARQARAPALFLAAEQDAIIPPAHARKLFEAWAGRKQIHVLNATDHNDIETHPDYYRLINEFLAAE